MSIDIIKAKQEFRKYVKNYNEKDPQIKLKIEHIERTAQVAKKMAISLQLMEEDIKLAELIGLLHDIGRFEQIKKYHTFLDKDSINHGEFGVKILFEEGLIRKFIEETKYDEIIKNAILNHNRAKIDENLGPRETLHAKIIRDSDKIDIFYILTFDKTKTIYGVEDFSNQNITDIIYEEFMECKLIDYKHLETEADSVVAHFAYVYDFYFDYSLKLIKDQCYLEKLYKRYKFNNKETMKRYNEIYNCAKKYICDRLKIKI